MAKSSQKDASTNTGNDGKATIVIKKYPNLRLYNTATSSYIVLDDIVELIKQDVDFVIEDTKTGEDLTRSILNQIIFEQEVKPNDFHFSLDVQKKLISLYGDTYAKMMPDYLSESISLFEAERNKFTSAFESMAETNALAMFEYAQSLAKQNMEMFRQSMKFFTPEGFSPPSPATDHDKENADQEQQQAEIKALQEQIEALQERIKKLQ